jgi:hypothetical protein
VAELDGRFVHVELGLDALVVAAPRFGLKLRQLGATCKVKTKREREREGERLSERGLIAVALC